MLRCTTQLDGAIVASVTVAGGSGETLDDIVVAKFDCDVVGTFTRVAVISPSENLLMPHSRSMAHQAAGVTRSWLRSTKDPLVALTGANTAVFENASHHALTSTVNVAWADFVAGDEVQLICAGRVGGGTVAALTRNGTRVVPLVAGEVIATAARNDLSGTVFDIGGARRGGVGWGAEEWLRSGQHLDPDDWVNAPLGMKPVIEPDMYVADGEDTFEQLLVSTPGFEIGDTPVSWLGFERHLNALTSRDVPVGKRTRHSDIAAAVIVAAGPDDD